MKLVDRAAERFVRDTLLACDIVIDGARPWDLRVRDPRWFRRMLVNPAFTIGESYLDGDWECDRIDELFYRLMTSDSGRGLDRGWKFRLRELHARVVNRQSRGRATQVAEHYDLDTDLYRAMLDETLTYTCGVWLGANDTLADAQRHKLQRVCEQLELQPGETLLDIGCGFGGLARFAAERHGARVLGITNSREHQRLAAERCAGLPHVEIRLLDYRDLRSLGRRFDKVASIEMIEAVGPKNYDRFMAEVQGCLRPGGRFFLQSFLSDTSQLVCNEWFDRYIFPNGVSPSLQQLDAATASRFGAPLGYVDLGAHYPPTLLAWDERLTRARSVLPRAYPLRFWRMWHYYLRCLAGVFRAGDLHLVQILYQLGGERRVVRSACTSRDEAAPQVGRTL